METRHDQRKPGTTHIGDRMIPAYILILCLRIQVATVSCSTDYECELTARAAVCLIDGDAAMAAELMDAYDADQ